MDTFFLILRILAILGIIVFAWSVTDSLEKIAKALRQLADTRSAGQKEETTTRE
jgi:hypothetical protein